MEDEEDRPDRKRDDTGEKTSVERMNNRECDCNGGVGVGATPLSSLEETWVWSTCCGLAVWYAMQLWMGGGGYKEVGLHDQGRAISFRWTLGMSIGSHRAGLDQLRTLNTIRGQGLDNFLFLSSSSTISLPPSVFSFFSLMHKAEHVSSSTCAYSCTPYVHTIQYSVLVYSLK